MTWDLIQAQSGLSYMTTRRGHQVSFVNPTVDDIDIDDIAWSLSMQCRYAGHTTRFYSVAEHSCRVARAVLPENKLAALLHDATEAYVTDIPRGLKNLLPAFRRMEATFAEVIRQKFNLPFLTPPEVLECDLRILLNEKGQVFPTFSPPFALDPRILPLEETAWTLPYGLKPEVAYTWFLEMFNALQGGK
jgi:hypothetical protein